MQELEKSCLVSLLNSDNAGKIAETLLYIAFNVNDTEWATELFMEYADTADEDISGLALTCLGHLARINGTINREMIIPFLIRKIENTEGIISARAQDAIDDINTYS